MRELAIGLFLFWSGQLAYGQNLKGIELVEPAPGVAFPLFEGFQALMRNVFETLPHEVMDNQFQFFQTYNGEFRSVTGCSANHFQIEYEERELGEQLESRATFSCESSSWVLYLRRPKGQLPISSGDFVRLQWFGDLENLDTYELFYEPTRIFMFRDKSGPLDRNLITFRAGPTDLEMEFFSGEDQGFFIARARLVLDGDLRADLMLRQVEIEGALPQREFWFVDDGIRVGRSDFARIYEGAISSVLPQLIRSRLF